MAKASMDSKAIELTVVFIVIGILLIPIGLKQILTVNKTQSGITAGSTTETIVDNLAPIGLIGVLIGLVYWFKGGK
jgi:hypothetical protein